MSSTSFEVAYDGDALADGTMDVRQLAPALLCVGKLIEHSNQVLNGDRATVAVHVKTGTQPGSFPVDLELVFGLAEQVSAVFGGSDVKDAQEMLALLGFLGPTADGLSIISSLLAFFKITKGRKPRVIETLEDGNVKVEIPGDDNQVTINKYVFQLGQDPQVRRDMEGIVRPLQAKGVEEFQVREDGEVIERVTREEAKYITATPVDEDVEVSVGEDVKWVTITRNVYEESRRFQFSDGASTFSATVDDDAFWEAVHKDDIKFSEHAQFQVRVRWRQERSETKVSMDYLVTEVLQHMPAPIQGDLLRGIEEPGKLLPGPEEDS